jgi:hypothetical protein
VGFGVGLDVRRPYLVLDAGLARSRRGPRLAIAPLAGAGVIGVGVTLTE